jgi:hypothetical protein
MLSFESHIVVKGPPVEKLITLCQAHNFTFAVLAVDSGDDGPGNTILTTRDKTATNAEQSIRYMIEDLNDEGIVATRYKVELTLLDSKQADVLRLLD